MKTSLKGTAHLILINYLIIVLLLVACGATPTAETTSVTQEIDPRTIPRATVTVALQVAVTRATATFTPVVATPLSSPTTPSPLATPSPPPGPTLTPTRSPLGGWLVFESAREDTNGDGIINGSDNIHIYSLDLSTNELRQLTFGEYRDLHPSWSPDRSEIAFTSNRSGNYDLFVMDADGSKIRQLTETPEDETLPIWSADGLQIIYVVVRALENGLQESYLYTVSANGENKHQLVFLPGNSSYPDLSPDGRFLAYTQVEPFSVEGQLHTGTVVYIHDMQSDENIRITSPGFESNKGEFERPKWLPRQGWYLSMVQIPGDLNPSGMKVFELSWDKETLLLHQVLEFDEAGGIYTWGPNGEWLISRDSRTVFIEDGEAILVTDLAVVPIVVPTPRTQLALDPAIQSSEHLLPDERSWLTYDSFYEGYLDWAP